MATFTTSPPWTMVRCPSPSCQWRGPLGKAVKDQHDYARCPQCQKPVEKVSTKGVQR